MKRELGISIYPDHSDPQKDKEYVKKAAALGYQRLFMSMLEISDNKDAVTKKFKEIITYAHQLGFEVILDINPAIFKQLGISYDNLKYFADLGASGIRLDEGFDGLKESLISYNPYGLNIELNMSNNVAYLDNILSYKANKPMLYGCHNFYPQAGTGLPYDFFVKCCERFKKHGIKTSAFVTSQNAEGGPWNVNDGLPTLEMDRRLPLALQTKHMFATDLIDTVIIGNAYASDEELKKMAAVNRYCLTLDINYVPEVSAVEKQILEDNLHFRRGDINSLVIRSTQTRVKYAQDSNPPHDNEVRFEKGDIVVGNDDFKKYKNELQIVLEPHIDPRKNLVGKIPANEMMLLDFIKPWSKFKIKNAQE